MKDISENLFKLINVASQFSSSRKCFGDDVVSSSELEFIGKISQLSPCSIKTVAQELNVTSSACSQQVDKLVKKMYIKRVTDKADRRGVKLTTTTQGEKLLQKFLCCQEDLLKDLNTKLAKFSDKQCNQIIEIITEALQQKVKEHNIK